MTRSIAGTRRQHRWANIIAWPIIIATIGAILALAFALGR